MVKRYDCLKILSRSLSNELVVTTLGATAMEWQSLNDRDANIYSMGMGLVAGTGLGIALALPHRKVIVLESDGSMLMSLGILPVIAQMDPKNLTVICFDNECYSAAGGFPSATADVADLCAIARGVGIKNVKTVKTLEEFGREAKEAGKSNKLSFIVVKTERWDADVLRPSMDGIENKYRFTRYIETSENIVIFPSVRP